MNDDKRRKLDADWDDDAIEIRSRRHRSVQGGKAFARTSDGASAPAHRAAPQGAGAQSAPARRPAPQGTGAQSAPARRPAPQGTGAQSAPAQRPAPQGTRAHSAPARRPAPQGTGAQSAPARRPAPQGTGAQSAPARRPAPQGTGAQSAPARRPAPQGSGAQSAPARISADGRRRQTSITNGQNRPASDVRRAVPAAPAANTPAGRREAERRRSVADDVAIGRGVSASRSRTSGKPTVGCVIRRSLLVLGTLILLVVAIVFAVVAVIAHGPSETARNKAVMSAMQASATKWVPGLFLSDETVEKIIEDSKVVVTDVKPITDVGGGEDAPSVVTEDRWAKAKEDGILLEFITGKTFKGYVLLIKDPSRVSVAIKNKDNWDTASRIFEIVEQYNALAAINGGEFPDNGVTTLANPIGLTYSGGECVWDDGLPRTFMGFTKDNKLVVEEGTNRARADELGIRDAVAFQTGNTLITNDGENVTYYYADSNTGVAQRTAIGQLADGTVMFLVTDGRTAQSLGATKNDIIDTFIEYGAVTAGMLDGGTSAMLWYRDWYTKYGVSEDSLDDWQKKGLVNVYKAFTNPRAIPSYFIVN